VFERLILLRPSGALRACARTRAREIIEEFPSDRHQPLKRSGSSSQASNLQSFGHGLRNTQTAQTVDMEFPTDESKGHIAMHSDPM
jgi:hypothetical protein